MNLKPYNPIVVLLVSGALIVCSSANSATVNLGTANSLDWSLLSVGGATVTVNNESIVRDFDENGNNAGADSRQLGIQGGKLQMSGGAYIGGPVRLADGTDLGITDSNTIAGGIYGTNISGDPKGNTIFNVAQDSLLNQAASDAAFYSNLYSGLSATNTSISAITDTLTVTASGGQNVLNLGELKLGGGEVLTLDGGGTDSSFIVNIFGDLTLNSGRIELSGGLTFDEVLFNVIGGKVSFSGGGNSSTLMGIILALDKEIALSPGLVQGSIIGTKISLVSGADLDTPIPPIPVPAAVWLFGTALLGLVGFSKRRKA